MISILFGLGIVCFVEGALWTLFPEQMKRAALAAAATEERVLRMLGLGTAIFGVLLVWLVR